MSKRRKHVLAVVAVAGLLGCLGPSRYRYTPSGVPGAAAAAPHLPPCQFAVAATVPASGYEQIGILEFQDGVPVNTATDFRQAIGVDVCQAGGDLAVTQINGYGYYVRAVVLRRIPDVSSGGSSEPAVAAPMAPPAAAPAAPPAAPPSAPPSVPPSAPPAATPTALGTASPAASPTTP